MRAVKLRLLLVLFLCLSASVGIAGEPKALVLEVVGPIGPATSDYVSRSLSRVSEKQATIVIIRMDTPGGLDTSMRQIIQDVLASNVPVVSFVAPSGARAASAGAYILYASHVAAMAPGTNVGAATPVQIGGIPDPGKDKRPLGDSPDFEQQGTPSTDSAMKKKMVNDAVAYIRSLAQMRGRNVEWAEQAVREAASLPAEQALKENVIDLMAADIGDLLSQLDGRAVSVLGQAQVLKTEGMVPVYLVPDWRTRLLAIITDPNVAYILMLIGIYGLFFEFANPGFVLPGVAGAICLVLALFAFQVLPVNYAGVALILLGILFMIGEAFVPSFGALGLGGLIAFVVGSIILFEDAGEAFQLSYPLIGAFALVSGGFILGIGGMAARSRQRPIVTGREQMIGLTGVALEDFAAHGTIRVHGEVWSADAQVPVSTGQKVKVIALDGLVLRIEPLLEE